MAGKTLSFGVGSAYADDVPFGILQTVNVDIAATVKELYGENIFPEAIGVGTHKISGSAAFARWNNELLPRYMFGTEMKSGSIQRVEEGAAVPAVTPFTVTPAKAADFNRNIGVIDASNGAHLKRVASAPAAGQYAVDPATGIYTFNSAQAGASVILRYDIDESTGQHFEMVNRRMGEQYPFTLTVANSFQGKAYAMTLYQCVITKWGMAFKNDDFAVPAVEFSCFTNDANVLGRFDFSDVV